MFHLMIEWRATSPRDDTEVRLANTLRSAAVSITITSLTQLLAFCIGATSPFLAVRNFCACSGSIAPAPPPQPGQPKSTLAHFSFKICCLQCFDAVGLAAGRTSGL